MRPDTQCARVLRVLADGQWHTVPEIHRKAGTMRLNSRVAELRTMGYGVECQTGAGKGAGRYRYRLTTTPGLLPQFMVDAISQALRVEPETPAIDGDNFAPRDAANRYRIYRLTDADELDLVATTPTAEGVGVTLCTLGPEGEFMRAAVGVLDTHGDNGRPGSWIVNPYEARTR